MFDWFKSPPPPPAPGGFVCFSCGTNIFHKVQCHEDAWYTFHCEKCGRAFTCPVHPDKIIGVSK